MNRKMLLIALMFVLAIPAFAGRIVYTVDPATALPQPATVVASGEGEVKVFFNVSEFESGMVFSFTLDMKTKGDNVTYPVTASFKEKGNKKDLTIVFDPAEVTFEDGETSVSTLVTLTLPEDDYSDVKKVKAKFKADAGKGSHLGQSAGVKVILLKAATAQEFMQAVAEELNEKPAPEEVETK